MILFSAIDILKIKEIRRNKKNQRKCLKIKWCKIKLSKIMTVKTIKLKLLKKKKFIKIKLKNKKKRLRKKIKKDVIKYKASTLYNISIYIYY